MVFSMGNVKSYLKTLEFSQKWQEKKSNNQFGPTAQAANQLLPLIRQSSYSVNTITSKLNTGKKLSPGEMQYLREKYPDIYIKATRIAAERAAYERELRSCKTKDEVRRMRMSRASGFVMEARAAERSGDPEACADVNQRSASISDAHVGFTQTRSYKRLPNDYNEMTREKKKKSKSAGGDIWVSKPAVEKMIYEAANQKKPELHSARTSALSPKEKSTENKAEIQFAIGGSMTKAVEADVQSKVEQLTPLTTSAPDSSRAAEGYAPKPDASKGKAVSIKA